GAMRGGARAQGEGQQRGGEDGLLTVMQPSGSVQVVDVDLPTAAAAAAAARINTRPAAAPTASPSASSATAAPLAAATAAGAAAAPWAARVDLLSRARSVFMSAVLSDPDAHALRQE
ncbi:unnamed protein product, partial [Closterium sp. NIES-54]